MAREVQGLLVQIEASTAQLRREMANADRAVAGSTKKIDKELSLVDRAMDRLGLRSDQLRVGMSRAFVGIATSAAAAGASIAALTKQGMAAVDAQAKLARSLDTSFGSITALQMAAGDSGLDGLEGSLTRLNRRLGAAEVQSGAAAKAVKALNLDLKALSAMDVDERVATIADAIRDSGHSMQRAARHAQDLGFEQKEAAQFFMQGGDAIRAYRDQVDQLGLSLSDIDAQKVVEAGNAMGVFGDLTRGVTQRLAVELSPILQQISEDVGDMSRETQGFSEEVTAAMGKAVTSVAFVADAIDGVGRVFSTVGKTAAVIFMELELMSYKLGDSFYNGPIEAVNELIELLNIVPGIDITPRALSGIGQEIKQQIALLEGAIKEGQRDIQEGLLEPLAGEKILDYYNKAVKAAEDSARAFVESGKDFVGTLDETGDSAGQTADELRKLDAAAKAHTAAIDALIAKYDPATKAQAEYEKALAVADKALARNGITTKQYQQILKGLADDLNKPIWDKHNKAVAEAEALYRQLDDQVSAIRDRLDPLQAATRKLAQEKELLAKAVDEGAMSLQEYELRLRQLDEEYEKNTRATTQWTEWTESALERVDSAFADAWRNIGDGFSSFRDSLTNSFKQMLAELAHMAITRPIIMQIGAAMGIGGGGGMAGIGGGSSGGLGGALQVANQGRGLLSMYGTAQGMFPALQGGWASGGFGGALQAGGSYIGSLFGVGSGAAASSAAGSTAAGYTGQAYATWLASQGAGAAGAGAGASSAISSALSGVSSMLTNPVTWIAAGMLASNKLYSDGVRADGSAIRAQYSDSGSSSAAKALGGITSIVADITKWTDKAMDPAGIFGRAVPILTGSPVTQAVNMGLARLFGGGEQFKRTVGSAQGVYSGGEYTGMGAVESFYGGSRKFGDDFDGALHDLAGAFSSSLGGLFDMFDIDSTIETEVTGRLRRTSGRLAADFYATIEGELVHVFGQYGRKGNVGESMEAFFDDIMGRGLVEAIAASSLPEYLKELTAGLTEAEEVADTISSLVTRFTAVNDVIELVNVSAFAMTDAGLRGADALIAMSGGLESLLASTATYYDQFFSAAEKQADTIAAVEKAFAAADITLADSREGYRAMVEDIDVTTEAGQQMFATMMGLAGRAAEYYSIVEQQAAQALATAQAAQQQALAEALGGASSAFAMLQRSVLAERNRLTAEFNRAAQAEQAAAQKAANAASASASARASALNSAASASQELVRVMQGLDRAMVSALDRLRSTDSAVVALRREQSVSMLRDALDWGRAGNSLTAFDGLEGALDVAATLDTGTFRTLTDFQREQGRTSHLIYELQQLNGEQLTIEERMLEQLRASASAAQASASRISSGFSGVSAQLQEEYDAAIAALDAELNAAQAQMDALNGVDNSIMSVGAAVDQMSAAVVAAIYAQNQYLTGGDMSAEKPGATAGLEATIARMYQSTLGVSADQQGIAHWLERLQGGDTLRTLQDALNAAARTAAIPAFASGGIHSGGLRLVGEHGPELEVTGPSRIYSAGQTASMLNGGGNAETVAELRQLRTEVHNDLRAIAKHTMQTAKRMDGVERVVSDWDAAGVPQERAFA